MEGWIKLNRDILESKMFANPNDLKIWLWLMLKASTKDRFYTIKTGKGSQNIDIKRGQLIFGRHKAETELKIDGSTIYRTLQRFADEQRITVKANNQYSIITVNDFIESQAFTDAEDFEIFESEQPITENPNNQRTTNEQPMSNQRTSNEQVTNTVLESLECKEGLESSEGKEGEKGLVEEKAQPDGKLFDWPEIPKPDGKKKKGNTAPREILMPYESFEFSQAWANWKEYKAGEFLFKYRSLQSEQAALMALANMASDGGEELAIKILNHTMANGWKGFVIPKTETNGHSKNGTNGHSTTTGGVDLKTRITSANEKYGY